MPQAAELNYFLVKSILSMLIFVARGDKITSAISFDTLAYVKKLKAAGVPEKQAEAQAETFAEIIEDRIATKQDVIAIQKDIKTLGTSLPFSILQKMAIQRISPWSR